MKRKYEGLIVLNTRGKEDTVDTLVSKLGREMELEGATLDQIDHLGKKKGVPRLAASPYTRAVEFRAHEMKDPPVLMSP